DSLDGVEVAVPADRPRGAAVRERPVQRQVEAVVAGLERRPVERALAVLGRGAGALRALPRPPAGALLEEEGLDASVGGALERLRPAGCGPAAAARLLAPALERLALTA